MSEAQNEVDVAVVGAGFAGLSAALRAQELGARTALFESLRYPGGCASTFVRGGEHFETGATLFAGFGNDQAFGTWMRDDELDARFVPLDPVVSFRSQSHAFDVSSSRDAFVAKMVEMAPASKDQILSFFAYQKKVADALWQMLDQPDLLPPFGMKTLLRLSARAKTLLPLVGCVGKTLDQILLQFHLLHVQPLRSFLDSVCQITIQTSAAQAEAPFALATLDYFFRGTGHIEGGIGRLAWAMAKKFESFGGVARFSNSVQSVKREGTCFRIRTRKSDILARHVVFALPPANIRSLLGTSLGQHPSLDSIDQQLRNGWSAAMLYISLPLESLARASAHHLDLVDQNEQAFVDGNHVFVSVSDAEDAKRNRSGLRSVTVSTHVSLEKIRSLTADQRGAHMAAVHERMKCTLQNRWPECDWKSAKIMTASPRTFERFTQRQEGMVGGIPRVAGLHNYKQLLPIHFAKGLHAVGDSYFPGQSILAASISGRKMAEALV